MTSLQQIFCFAAESSKVGRNYIHVIPAAYRFFLFLNLHLVEVGYLDLENGIIVNMHIRSIDQSEAIKTIKRKITDLDKMKIEEQKKAVRSGYDMDIIPSDLATFGSEAKNLLQDLQSRNERMFLLTFLVVNMADTKRCLMW